MPVEPIQWLFHFTGMMTYNQTYSFKLLAPFVLASTLLMSAPFFVMLDNTLYGQQDGMKSTAAPAYSSRSQTTVIYKS
jgi:hypothetical protein